MSQNMGLEDETMVLINELVKWLADVSEVQSEPLVSIEKPLKNLEDAMAACAAENANEFEKMQVLDGLVAMLRDVENKFRSLE